MDLPNNLIESQDIYETLCNSQTMFIKYLDTERKTIDDAVSIALGMWFKDNSCNIFTGSKAEGTNIASEDYGRHAHSSTPLYVSDQDRMQVLYGVTMMDEGDILPQRFDNHIYCQAERGEHTTDGFRKLRIIHSPQYYSQWQFKAKQLAHSIKMSVDDGFISNTKFLAETIRMAVESPKKKAANIGLGTQGPSVLIEQNGHPNDFVPCFWVKTWPKEAESWFTRQTHWPDQELKSKIRVMGYLLVPTGNRKSNESDLEWRSSFSIAERSLFEFMTKLQKFTFIILKVLLKEYLPSDINTDGEKQLLSTYHTKTLFMWCLEDSMVEDEPGKLLANIGHMLNKLLRWINQQYIPHYFIPSINLIDSTRLHGREKSLIASILAIRNDLSNKIKQSKFFIGQKMAFHNHIHFQDRFLHVKYIIMYVRRSLMYSFAGRIQSAMHDDLFGSMLMLKEFNFSHSRFTDCLISMKHPDLDPQSLPSNKLLMEVVPVLMDQYRGCIHLAKYCMAARGGHVMLDVLHRAESLLKDTLHLDPCSGYVKLACLYIVTGDFVKAMDILHAGEHKCVSIHKNMVANVVRNLQLEGIEVERFSIKLFTVTPRKIFEQWKEGRVTSDIAVTWLEYITVPDLLQFELIHESTHHVKDVPRTTGDGLVKMVALDFFLKFPPLSLIKLLKFVCNFYSGRSFTGNIENLVEELILSALSVTVVQTLGNDIYTVFNMAAWCYIKLKKYKPASRMMTVAIESSSEDKIMERCAFSHHFAAYVLGQCLATGSRVLVYKRDNVWQKETESWFTRETMSGKRKQSPDLPLRDNVWQTEAESRFTRETMSVKRKWSPGLQERQSLASGSRVLVYKRDNVWQTEAESRFTREKMSGKRKRRLTD